MTTINPEQNYTSHRSQNYDNWCKMAMIDLLAARGWKFDNDGMNPNFTFANPVGWWINPDHETKCRRVGDSKPMQIAAADTVALYTDITPDEVWTAARGIQREETARRYKAAGYNIPALA